MKYLIYARRSSEDKSKQIQSIPDQLTWAHQIALEKSLEVIGEFTDSKTATKPGREGFNDMMMKIAESAEPLGLICWKMDRLARNPVDEGTIKYAFMQGKIKNIMAKDREFREGENQILMGVEFGAATQYSIELGRNVRRGMRSKVEKGWRPGVAVLGYINDPFGLKGEKKIFRDKERWNDIRKLWDLALTGIYSIPQILKKANELGIHSRKGMKLSQSTLHKILRNPFYAGLMNWKGEVKQGLQDPMITLEEFERVQTILDSRNKHRERKHLHTYNGLIKCAECGGMITAEPPKIKINKKDGKAHIYHYLRCSKRKTGIKCSQKYIQVKDLESQINKLLLNIEIPEAIQGWVFKQIRKEHDENIKNLSHRRGHLQTQINENEALIETLTRKLLKGVIDDETYKTNKSEFEMQRHLLKEEITKYDNKKDNWLERAEKDFKFACNAHNAFVKASFDEKRRIFNDFGSNFLLKDKQLLLEAKFPFELIKVGVEKTKTVLLKFEPIKNSIGITKTPLEEALSSIWSG